MKIEYNCGSMYVELESDEKISVKPISLGKIEVKVGDCIKKLGEGKKNSFYLDGDMTLKYVGCIDENLLFNTNNEIYDYNKGKVYYCFIKKSKDVLILKTSETVEKELDVTNIEISYTLAVKAKGGKIEEYVKIEN